MSKPVKNEVFELLKEKIFKAKKKKNEFFMQLLSLLNSLKSGKESNLVRLSSEVSQMLNDEKNYEKIQKAKNLDELLKLLEDLNKTDKMLKIYSNESLKTSFPELAKKNFL